MAENEYQEEGATEIDFVMRNYEYANMAADMGQCRFGFATDLKAVCAKGDSGATVYKFLKDASGSSNTASTRILFADANGAASSHASLTFDGTTLKIAGALRKAGESGDNLTLGAAGLVTLGGNLALGANTISVDGSANKGFGVSATGIPKVTATASDSGDARTVLRLYDDTAYEINNGVGNGAGINLYGKTKDDGTYAIFGGIKVSKENGVSGDNSASFYIQSRKEGSDPANALRLDSDQNGYIKNKLMVGALTETPTVNLAVYSDNFLNACLLSVSDAYSGPNAGLVIGVDTVVRTNGTPLNSQCVIRAEGYGRDIYVQSETATPNVFDTFIACEKLGMGDDKTVTIADKLVVDGDAQIEGLTASQIVETDASKILISVAKGTAYNANFGTGSSNVCRGNDPRLSDARTPINNDYYVQGNSSSRTTYVGDTDVDSYSQSGFYRSASAAPHNPTATGYGIIHTNHTSNSEAFQLASRWSSNRLYYRVENDGTWEPWVELYHTGNLNPVDVDYSSISTVVGFSGTPNVIIKYREILGGLVVVRFSISGTSNSTRFYFSLPFTSLQVVPSGVCSFASDNSSYVPTPVKISVSLDGYVCLDKGDWSSSSGDGWTASNGKSATGTIVFLRS